ncbi:MAG: hypothetical protein KGZ30_02730 [Anaplasmataceae bacterium]|nr:hypothetical protein [Anaplasmataceae bacterium]
MEHLHLEWYAPEYEHRPKGVSWYWGSMLTALLILLLALWQQNYLFAAIVVIAEILIIVWANREPRSIHFVFTEKGIEIDRRKKYRWENIIGFGIADDLGEENPKLYLFRQEHYRTPLIINLPRSKRKALEVFIESKLPRYDVTSSLSEVLDEFTRF